MQPNSFLGQGFLTLLFLMSFETFKLLSEIGLKNWAQVNFSGPWENVCGFWHYM